MLSLISLSTSNLTKRLIVPMSYHVTPFTHGGYPMQLGLRSHSKTNYSVLPVLALIGL